MDKYIKEIRNNQSKVRFDIHKLNGMKFCELTNESYDIGVDNNQYYPVSYKEIKTIISELSDNFNLIKNRRY